MHVVSVSVQTTFTPFDLEHISTLPVGSCYLRPKSNVLQPRLTSPLPGDKTRCELEPTHYTSQPEYKEQKEELLSHSIYSHGNLKFSGTHQPPPHEEEEEEEGQSQGNRDRPTDVDDHDAALAIITLLKTCTTRKDLLNGTRIHADIITRQLLETNVFVGTSVVNMYAKCGSLSKAQEVFDALRVRNVVTWNALIAGYVQHRYDDEALTCFDQMQVEGISPTAVTFVCILKACNITGTAGKGQEIHALIIKEGCLENDVHVGSALVDFYARLGLLARAQITFDNIVNPNVVTWTALMGGYAYHGYDIEALMCYEHMQHRGLPPSAITMVCILKACASMGALDTGQEIHSQIIREGLLARDLYVGTALVDMYAKSGALAKAEEVCHELPSLDLASLNALISGYLQHNDGEKALQCFEEMQLEGFCPDGFTLACVIKACGSLGNIEKGQEIHMQMVIKGWFEDDNVIGAALIDMYAKCGVLDKAQKVFDKLPIQDVVSWNALIAGYAQYGQGEKALICYEKSCNQGLCPDAITFICILNACGSIRAVQKGEKVHADIVKHGLPAKDVVAANALMDMYIKCGLLEKAKILFNSLLVRDVVSWNTFITGFAQYENEEESVNCLKMMHEDGLSPDHISFMCALKASGSMGSADKGQKIHCQIIADGLLDNNLIIGTSLVDMYANCGMLAEAQEIFQNLPEQTLASWNAFIAAYAKIGNARLVFTYFSQMIERGLRPDSVTFTILLNTCSHTGLLDMGQVYFEVMCTSYGIPPNLEHYTSVVDLFSRAGHLEKAVALIQGMPLSASLMIWHTILRSCRKLRSLNLGKLAFEYAAQLDEMDGAAYAGLKNAYADAGRHEDVCMYHETNRAAVKKLHLNYYE